MAKKKPKLGKVLTKTPITQSFDDIMEEARAQIFDRAETPTTLIKNDSVILNEEGNLRMGKFVLFKASEEAPLKMGYECPCGNAEGAEVEFEKPYTIHCSKCETLIYVQEKVPKKGAKKTK